MWGETETEGCGEKQRLRDVGRNRGVETEGRGRD